MKRKVLFLTCIMSVFLGALSLFAMPAGDNAQKQDISIKASPRKIRMLNFKYSDNSNKILSGGISSFKTKNAATKQSKIKAVDDFSKFEGRKFFGDMINKNGWADSSIVNVPCGFYSYSIDNSSTPTFTPLFTGMGLDYLTGAYTHGKFYGIRPVTMLGALAGATYNALTTDPWAIEREKAISEVTYDMLASSMAYDETSNQIYALEYNEDLTGLYWSTFNKETFSFDIITKWKGKFDALAMIAVPDGNIYCIGTDGDFYSIDKKTGTPSLIGSTGITPDRYLQSATYDGKTGTILWYAVTTTGNNLYSVNIATGEASYIRNFPENNQLIGLYITDNDAVDAAPAAIGDFNIAYITNEKAEATVNFTIPSQTFAGQSLTGDVNLKLWIDGQLIKDENATPGTSYSIPYTFSNDNHYVAITTVNSAGISPSTDKYFYAGYDIPKSVQNLSFTIQNGVSNLNWEAPVGGINNGYINSDSLFYKVYRYPGEVLVADNLKNTSFRETLSTDMQNYFYSVTAYNGKNKAGIVDSTKLINYGSACPIPYTQLFDDSDPLKFFTIIDGNKDGQKWTLFPSSNCVTINTVAGRSVSADWLITPRLRLASGIKYKLIFSAKGFAENYPENLKISLGSNPSDTTTFKTTLKDMPNLSIGDFEDKTIEFSVPIDGDYSVGFYVYSDAAKSCMFTINKIIVDAIGNIGAPDSVSNLSVIRDANDELAATISFTTPSKNLIAENLSSISNVNIYRGDATEPVYTFHSPQVNTKLTWIDTNVPQVGVTKYRAVAENENGVGKPAEASDFIGVYTAPYLETFDTEAARALYTSEITLDGASDWKYDSTSKAISLSNFCMTAGDYYFNLYTPAIKLDADGVYQLSFKYTNSSYKSVSLHLTKGMSPKANAQTEFAQISNQNFFKFTSKDQMFITGDAGKYYLGVNVKSNTLFDCINFAVDSICVRKITSSKSPIGVDDLKITSDQTGNLSSLFQFKAPTYDYAGRELTSISKIDIFRVNSTIPLKTFNNPTPGEAITWTDSEALYGNNAYMILASNEFGPGKPVNDSVFVGKDIPDIITNLSIKADLANQKPTLTWNAPTKGANGGVLDTNTLSYSIYEYNVTSKVYSLIASNIKASTYTIDLSSKVEQDIFYYGVVPVTNEGRGEIVLSYITLGPLYQLPFKESFANGTSSTQRWVTNSDQTYASWTPSETINGIIPQDRDGGMATYFNQGYYTVVNGDLTSPKIALSGDSIILRFWLYQGIAANYSTIPFVSVSVSTDSGDFITAMDSVFTNEGTEAGWVEHTINITNLVHIKDASFLQFRFNSRSEGSTDIVYIDNISLVSKLNTGVESNVFRSASVIGVKNGIIIKGADRKTVNIYNVNGQTIASFKANENQFKVLSQGVYIVKIGNEVFKAFVK